MRLQVGGQIGAFNRLYAGYAQGALLPVVGNAGVHFFIVGLGSSQIDGLVVSFSMAAAMPRTWTSPT